MKQKRSVTKTAKPLASAASSPKVPKTKLLSKKPKAAARKPTPVPKAAKKKTSTAPSAKISPAKKLQPKNAKVRAATPQREKVVKPRNPFLAAARIPKAKKKKSKKFVPKPLKITAELQALIEKTLAKMKKKFSLNPDDENSDSIVEFSVFRSLFGICSNTAKDWVRFGFIDCSQIGRSRFIYSSDIHEMMRRFRE